MSETEYQSQAHHGGKQVDPQRRFAQAARPFQPSDQFSTRIAIFPCVSRRSPVALRRDTRDLPMTTERIAEWRSPGFPRGVRPIVPCRAR